MFGIEKIREDIEILNNELLGISNRHSKIDDNISKQMSFLKNDIHFEISMIHTKLDNLFTALSDLTEKCNKFSKKEEKELKKPKKPKKVKEEK